MKLVNQLMAEIKRKPEKFNQLAFGEIVFRVQNGKIVQWGVSETFKAAQAAGADPKNGRPQA